MYNERFSGVMSWFDGLCNSSNADNITLHSAGHARNNNYIELRFTRTIMSLGKLQIRMNVTTSGVSTYTFKFRKMI